MPGPWNKYTWGAKNKLWTNMEIHIHTHAHRRRHRRRSSKFFGIFTFRAHIRTMHELFLFSYAYAWNDDDDDDDDNIKFHSINWHISCIFAHNALIKHFIRCVNLTRWLYCTTIIVIIIISSEAFLLYAPTAPKSAAICVNNRFMSCIARLLFNGNIHMSRQF